MNPLSTSRLATDTHGVDALRSRAATDPKAAIKDAAKQFEALFMQELMKSMRAAQQSMSTGMFDNAGTQMGTDMLDQQFATKMTGLPGGLSDVIARQLERQMGGTVTPAANVAKSVNAALSPATAAGAPSTQKVSQRQSDFVSQHTEAARAAEAQTGIPASFMVSQAAHETGWGKHEIKNTDGSSAHNLFGIKAGANWKGKVAEVTTTEYVNGQPHKVTARFRAYGSYAESFADYAKLMKDSPRFQQVLANAGTVQGFAQGLQKAGYATDPAYADKLTRVINTTLRLQRSVA
ncbi:flagellar assembly peptidoglycan hydrolase FlgJ [Piscinibacter terrae]|uniref:Peptidoglycan hydrolase FlgJ n=1 Tax=Piscinibacter terrae TaxID=2496871 RepID=A0A3N7K2C4_9BURK|nr:flagellar assembly peptidoglycan hydrolase FlgJ [Albitalea terrae]RQP25085.1 flagellar assembly peptidoglycan hydrolase FlgJ [Albitalea terrae]